MANVLADLALESEAATAAALRLARAFEADAHDEHEQRIKRLVTPIIKYWTCKPRPTSVLRRAFAHPVLKKQWPSARRARRLIEPRRLRMAAAVPSNSRD